MDAAASALVEALRAELAAAADPAQAGPMQAYMKSSMPFLGIQTPARRRIINRAISAAPLLDRPGWTTAVERLWREAEYREERYAAIELTGHRRYQPYQDRNTLDLYDELIVTGAWWDYVDDVAIRRVGPILRADRRHVTPRIRSWITDADLWRRRAAIICQIGSESETDLALLTTAVESNIDDPDFFIRKAIGWALRHHARHDPDWVRQFVAEHPRLSGLSRREAIKHL